MTTAPQTLDLDFRPDYWDLPDPVAAVVQNIKGQLRRMMVADIVSGHAAATAPDPETAAALREVDPYLLQDELPERLAMERVDPRWMGGEYLPGYERGEVEIARIVLHSTLMDVISFRARRGRTGRIRFRVVDEYNSEFSLRPRSAARPLTLRGMIGLLDRVTDAGSEAEQPRGLLEALWSRQLEHAGPEDSASFAFVESEVYPQLQHYYWLRAVDWAAGQRAAMEREGQP